MEDLEDICYFFHAFGGCVMIWSQPYVEKIPDPEVRLSGDPKIPGFFAHMLPGCFETQPIVCEPNDRLLAASFLCDQDSCISQWNIWMTIRHLDQFWSHIKKSMESFGSSTFFGNVTFQYSLMCGG